MLYEKCWYKFPFSASETNDGQCIICDRKLPLNRTGYLKHIGVDHELVIEYLEKDASVRYIPLEIYKKQTDASPVKSKLSSFFDSTSRFVVQVNLMKRKMVAQGKIFGLALIVTLSKHNHDRKCLKD